MKISKQSYPYLAFVIGLAILGLVLIGAQIDNGDTRLPLFTLLILSEFGFILAASAAFIAIRQASLGTTSGLYKFNAALCLIMAAQFAYSGYQLWPNSP